MAAVIINAKSFNTNLRRIQRQVGKQLSYAVLDAGNMLEKLTYPEVPVDTGALRTSGDVQITSGNGFDYAEASIKYSANAPHNGYNYAWKQHEFPFRHPKGGTDHYLSKGVQTGLNFALASMASTIRRVL